MDLEALSDGDLLSELHNAQGDIPSVHADPEKRHTAWQRVIAAMRELERRYPPTSDPVA